MRAAVYCGTRNIYQDMIPSMKSLLIHSNVDKIYFLIEDDEFPYELPSEVECINVSNQQWFKKNGPNYGNSWSYMILLRGALTKIFPNLDKILSLDCDVIINENISDLWDIPLDNYYMAGVKELVKTRGRKLYINTGILLLNLKKIRDDKKDDEIIYDLNTYYRYYPEQDCFSEIFAGHILELPTDYNINNYSCFNYHHPKIIHFAAIKNWSKFPMVEKYRNAIIIRNQNSNVSLDIIIPYYNNLIGLETTLKSVVHTDISNIHITVVDDCSPQSCDELKDSYPEVQFLRLEKNSGPGAARQYGIDHTNGTYIMFIDTADYILSKYNLFEVIDTITNNTVPYMYLWRWLNAEHNSYSSDWNPLLHGWVFKREFLELYNIRFCEEGSRSNEDFGFVQSCNLILEDIKSRDKTKYFSFKETPIYMYVYDNNSITHANGKLYMYTTHIKGLVTNAKHVYNTCMNNKVDKTIIMKLMSEVMIRLYQDFLNCAKNMPEYLNDNWRYIREFYFDIYKQFEKINENYFNALYSNRMQTLIQSTSDIIPNINIKRFLRILAENEEFPWKL